MVEKNPQETPAKTGDAWRTLQIAWAVIVAELDAVRGAPVIVVPLVLCAALMFKEQGADLAVTAGSDLAKAIWLVLTTAFYGFQCWFWARLVVEGVEDRFAPPEPTDPPWVGKLARGLRAWTPRILGAAPFLIAAVATFKAKVDFALLPLILAALGLAAPFVFRARIPISRLLGLEDGPRFYLATQRITLVLAVGSLIVLCIWPVEPARFVGAIGVVFLGLSFITAGLAWTVNQGRRLRLPILAVLLLVIVLGGGWFNFNHVIGRRTLHRVDPTGAMALQGGKPTLEGRFKDWCQKQPKGCSKSQEAPTPIVFVAAEGGASRAGYWAADVLGRLQFDTQGGTPFSDRVFAISSVSGGSVGVISYVSTLADTPGLGGGAFADSVAQVAGVDYLSPAISGLLFPDLAYRVLPLPFVLPDRAETLESGFESGWRRHCRDVPRAAGPDGCDPELWTRPFLSLWRLGEQAPTRWLPVVLINGARQEDGRRIITSDVRVTPEVFANAVDFHDLTNRDVRVSTAIHNGARFPVVSPGGVLIAARRDDKGDLVAGRGQAQGHLIDGGYFDGGGVVTMAETAVAVLRLARAEGYHLKPVFIELNNDNDRNDTAAGLIRAGDTGACEAQSQAEPGSNPGADTTLQAKLKLPGADTPAAKACSQIPYPLHPTKTRRFLVDILGPVEGLASVRGAHGEAAGMALAQAAKDSTDSKGAKQWGVAPAYFLVHLCETKGVKLPMDWALSRSAMRRTDRLLGIQAAIPARGRAAEREAAEDEDARKTCRISRRMADIMTAVGATVAPDVQVRRVPGAAGDRALRIALGVTLALAALGAAANVWANGRLGAMKLPTTVSLQRLRTAEDFRRTTALWETPRTRPDAWRCLRVAFCFDLVLIVGYAGAIASAATLLAWRHPAQAGVLLAATALAVAAAVADLVEDALELRMIYVNLEGLAAADGQRSTEDVFARAAFVATCLKWAFLAGAVGALAWGLAAGWMTGG